MIRFVRILCFAVAIFLSNCKYWEDRPGVEKLPDVSLLDWDGEEVALQDFPGKVLILDFWATWCEPCSQSVPVLENLKARAGDDFVFLGINTDQNKSPESIRDHALGLGMTYPSLLDLHHVLSDGMGIQGLPGLFVYSRSGKLLYKQYGIKESDLPGLIARLSQWKRQD